MRVFTCLVLCVLALVCVTSSVVHGAPICRALALSGGGDKAAYEAGVLSGFLANLPPEETAYDVVTGISAGSTLTAALSVFNKGEEQQALQLIMSILSSLNQSSIFQDWPGGVAAGALFHSSLFDSTPLRKLLERELKNYSVSNRNTCMGACNVQSGGYETMCNHQSVESVINATLASAAIPGVFIPQLINNKLYVDGGTITGVDVITAIQQCLALGVPQQNIVVDVVSCDGSSISALSGDVTKLTTVPVLLRALQMRNYRQDEYDFVAAQHAFPNVNYRYNVFPSIPIPGSGIDFNPFQMKQMIELGQYDAANAIHAKKGMPIKPLPQHITFEEAIQVEKQ